MPKASTSAQLMRNKLGSLILKNAPEEEIQAQRQLLALATLEPQIQKAIEAGVSAAKIRRIAEKLAGAK